MLGANGMLGYAVCSFLESKSWNVHRFTRKEFDFSKDKIELLEQHLTDKRIDVVLNCAGVIKPQIDKNSIESVLKTNVMMPHSIAKLCKKIGVKGVHITTDCVYSGLKGQYSEEDFFDAEDVYGLSKLGGEPQSIMTLRTSIIGEEKGQSRSLVEWARSQKGNKVNGFLNHDWNGLTTLEVAKTIHEIFEKNAYSEGIFHLHSPNKLNKAELLGVLNEVYDLKLEISPIDAPEKIDRTLASVYGLSRDFVRNPIDQQVQEMKNFFENLD